MRVHREVDASHRAGARCIHGIVELPHGECVTSVICHTEGVGRRQPRFWRLRNGVMQSRRRDKPKFRRAVPTTKTQREQP